MSRKLNFLFIPAEPVGHMNAATGIAQVLIGAGHRTQFVITAQWKGRLTKYGIEEVLISLEDRPSDVDPAEQWADMFVNGGGIRDATALQKAINIRTVMMADFGAGIKRLDPIVERLLATEQPDVIVLDQFHCLPSVILSGIPWVATCSFNPLFFIYDERTPPYMSGLPITGPKSEWQTFKDAVTAVEYPFWQDFNKYVMSRGLPSLPTLRYSVDSQFLNIYGFPLELDYVDVRPLPPNWHRFDNLKRTDRESTFEIPAPLRNRSGKLIYLSLGSMGAADVDNMKRLVKILSKSRHRFIVSKGHRHAEYELADNMWGEGSVPQIQVLELVDLVITHGGNNTITETIYFGKPMIVLPLFADQLDNAQRIHEKGFGIRLDAYQCSETELLDSIESLLNNMKVNEKLAKMSQRIQSDNSIAKLPEIIEKLVKSYKL